MRTPRLLEATVLAALTTLALSGCVRLDVDLALQPDDTVDGSMVFAISSELAELSGQDPADLSQELQDQLLASQDGPENARTEPYEQDDFTGTTLHFEGEQLDLFGGEEGQDGLDVVREGDEFVVTGVLDLTQVADAQEQGLSQDFDVRVAVTFPGSVSDHNGVIDGRRVTWVAVAGERLEMQARGSAVEGGGGLSAGLLAGLVAALLVAAGLVVLLVTRSRSTPDRDDAVAVPQGIPQQAVVSDGPAAIDPSGPPEPVAPAAPPAATDPPAPVAPPAPAAPYPPTAPPVDPTEVVPPEEDRPTS
ncbi:hypothetical protein [Actinotalea sp. K2]|uniref:LppM family (lipo)protein n=1 Tax=Actinotalea sp. K2 TaxID=2939438 RepID=UPI002016A7A5|nr:hypothetical protein [Actinotalea sp. K2]MCL3863185.1 hypothetical protein [Actinotalea sp. K2]